MHKIGFFVCHGHDPLDLAGPLTAFNHVTTVAGHSPYSLHVLSHAGGLVAGNTRLSIVTEPAAACTLDTVTFIGGDMAPLQAPENIAAARQLMRDASRVASVCTGAFLLAETGMLKGRRATTHWQRTAQLQSTFPDIHVAGDFIHVADGHVWTSAGITAGIDLALAMIDNDVGTHVARAVAQHMVVPYRRSGGQSQFSTLSHLELASDRIRLALNHARAHLNETLSVEQLADAARLSPRQFGRVFRRETGETPAKAVERLRVEAARLRLQEGCESIETIARAVGFIDPERMRRAFIKRLGHPPQAVRRMIRKNDTP